MRFLLLALLATGHAGEPGAPGPLQIAADLVDGSRIVGSPRKTHWTIPLEDDALEIAVDRVLEIDFPGDRHMQVTLANLDELRGQASNFTCEVDCLLGRFDLRGDQIRRIRVWGPVNHEGLLLHWDFEGEDPNVARDRSGHARDGRIQEAQRVVGGISGQGIAIGNPRQLVEREDAELNLRRMKAFSVSVWFRLERETTYGTVLSRMNPRGKGGRPMLAVGGRHGNQWIPGGFCGARSAKVFAANRAHPAPGEWFHLAGTWKGGTARLYVNGELEGEANGVPLGGEWDDRDDYVLTLGRARGHRNAWHDAYPHGILDELKIWDRCLTPGEIKQIHRHLSQRGKPGSDE